MAPRVWQEPGPRSEQCPHPLARLNVREPDSRSNNFGSDQLISCSNCGRALGPGHLPPVALANTVHWAPQATSDRIQSAPRTDVLPLACCPAGSSATQPSNARKKNVFHWEISEQPRQIARWICLVRYAGETCWLHSAVPLATSRFVVPIASCCR